MSLQVGSGFSGECVRTGKLLRSNDTEADERVDRQSCRALGIRSIIAAPVILGEKVIGLLEVFSAQPNAFRRKRWRGAAAFCGNHSLSRFSGPPSSRCFSCTCSLGEAFFSVSRQCPVCLSAGREGGGRRRLPPAGQCRWNSTATGASLPAHRRRRHHCSGSRFHSRPLDSGKASGSRAKWRTEVLASSKPPGGRPLQGQEICPLIPPASPNSVNWRYAMIPPPRTPWAFFTHRAMKSRRSDRMRKKLLAGF